MRIETTLLETCPVRESSRRLVDRSARPTAKPSAAEQPGGAGEPPAAPSRRSLRGLDWFIFFVADVQTGFGPFVSVYLTTQRWTQVDIGLVLSAAGFVSLIGQMPGGALVDAAKSERFVAGIAVAAICVSALSLCGCCRFFRWCWRVRCCTRWRAACSVRRWPRSASAWSATPRSANGSGRNARFASVGNGLAAAAMGACGYLLSARAVFIVTVLLLIPALLALRTISNSEIDPERAHGARPRRAAHQAADRSPAS